jgi:hypothetical protein
MLVFKKKKVKIKFFADPHICVSGFLETSKSLLSSKIFTVQLSFQLRVQAKGLRLQSIRTIGLNFSKNLHTDMRVTQSLPARAFFLPTTPPISFLPLPASSCTYRSIARLCTSLNGAYHGYMSGSASL